MWRNLDATVGRCSLSLGCSRRTTPWRWRLSPALKTPRSSKEGEKVDAQQAQKLGSSSKHFRQSLKLLSLTNATKASFNKSVGIKFRESASNQILGRPPAEYLGKKLSICLEDKLMTPRWQNTARTFWADTATFKGPRLASCVASGCTENRKARTSWSVAPSGGRR